MEAAPFDKTLHIYATHVPSRPPAPPHSCVYGLAPLPADPQAHDGAWCLSVNGTTLVAEAIDPVREAGAALREQGVHADTHVTLHSPSANAAYSGALKNMGV